MELAGGPRRGETGMGPSTWNSSSSSDHKSRVCDLLPALRDGPSQYVRDGGLPLAGISGQQEHISSNDKEQTLLHQSVVVGLVGGPLKASITYKSAGRSFDAKTSQS